MSDWHLVYTHAQAETTAHRHLRRQGFEVYLPRYAKQRRHARRVETATAPLFPRYLFVGSDAECAQWRPIRSTFGVSHLLCWGDAPARVRCGIVESIRAREDADGLIQMQKGLAFERGQRVQFVSGTFADHVGLFECRSDNERITVLLSLLGREVKITVPSEVVAAA